MDNLKPATAVVYTNEDGEGQISQLVYRVVDAETSQSLDIPAAASGVDDEARTNTLVGLEVKAQEIGYTIDDVKLAGEV